MENDDTFIGFTARKKDSSSTPKNETSENKFSAPGVEHKEVMSWTTFFLWAGILIALIGFVSFIVFVLGIASTFWSYMKIKSEAEIGNEIAKSKLASGKSALVIIVVLIPVRFLTLVTIGI